MEVISKDEHVQFANIFTTMMPGANFVKQFNVVKQERPSKENSVKRSSHKMRTNMGQHVSACPHCNCYHLVTGWIATLHFPGAGLEPRHLILSH